MRLKKEEKGQVHIVHIGDSHIQQDMMTCVVRKHFHEYFGNAGRGLIAPLKIAKTNEPFDYSIKSKDVWKNKKITDHTLGDKIEPGIGGLSIQTHALQPELICSISNRYGIDYRFDRVCVFYTFAEHDTGLLFRTGADKNPERVTQGSSGQRVVLNLQEPTETIVLSTENAIHHNSLSIYGISLEKNQSGVLYHTIGINGAKFRDYALSPLFVNQLQELSPDLIIFSLGTNEVHTQLIEPELFYHQIDSLIQPVRDLNPYAAIVLTTPVASMTKGVPDTRTQVFQQQILQYATDKNLAVWDLYTIIGGQNAPGYWQSREWLGKDGVHFTKTGYEILGDLFFQAFTNSINSWQEKEKNSQK
ncbi:MAG: hypothetical protein K1X92_14630 [Bacteroidia bacterium]|nr:hypothetical protein [Bacteroidia bacterium]